MPEEQAARPVAQSAAEAPAALAGAQQDGAGAAYPTGGSAPRGYRALDAEDPFFGELDQELLTITGLSDRLTAKHTATLNEVRGLGALRAYMEATVRQMQADGDSQERSYRKKLTELETQLSTKQEELSYLGSIPELLANVQQDKEGLEQGNADLNRQKAILDIQQKKIEEREAQVRVMEGSDLYKEKQQIDKQRAELAELKAQLDERNSNVVGREITLNKRQDAYEDRDNMNARRDEDLKKREAQVQAQMEEIDRRRRETDGRKPEPFMGELQTRAKLTEVLANQGNDPKQADMAAGIITSVPSSRMARYLGRDPKYADRVLSDLYSQGALSRERLQAVMERLPAGTAAQAVEESFAQRAPEPSKPAPVRKFEIVADETEQQRPLAQPAARVRRAMPFRSPDFQRLAAKHGDMRQYIDRDATRAAGEGKIVLSVPADDYEALARTWGVQPKGKRKQA